MRHTDYSVLSPVALLSISDCFHEAEFHSLVSISSHAKGRVLAEDRRYCWDVYDDTEQTGFHIVISEGNVFQSYRGCYGDIADRKCVVYIMKTVPAWTGTRQRCIRDVLKS